MQVTQPVTTASRLAVITFVLICSACQAPAPVPDNRYQRTPDSAATPTLTVSRPVQQLHNQALAAINEDQYAQATEYLQRAIKIQPRNGWSWYYLADVHQRQGESERCLSMLQRAEAYAQGDARLAEANTELRTQCQ